MENKYSDDIVKDLMPYVIQLVKEKAFTNPDQITDADALGIIVAKYLKWDGADIMETMHSALEDANYHTLNEKLLETYKDWENEDPSELDWNNTASPAHY
tara:strand:- start:385 stop:684 length:300 start_codon:yes stop_codon:yes gene_type:complete